MKKLSQLAVKLPKTTIVVLALLSLFFASQLNRLAWETDARVYLPKKHAAIKYDAHIDDVFGVRDTLIIGVVNEDGSVFNTETLARIQRLTEKVAALPGVQATRTIDVASLSTALLFVADETSMGSEMLMPKVPQTEEEIAALKQRVYSHAEIFVGNIISEDGSAAMIRAKLKEGIDNRYQTYFQVKGLLAQEGGEGWGAGAWGDDGGGDWQKWQHKGAKESEKAVTEAGQVAGDWQAAEFGTDSDSSGAEESPAAEVQGQSWPKQGDWPAAKESTESEAGAKELRDKFYLGGRPAIEVSSGLYALEDLKLMVPLVLIVLALVLLAIFRTLRGMFLPLLVMAMAILWTFGIMVLLGIPMYTISTMLPVILIAVGIGDAVHFLSHYYDQVLENPHQPAADIVTTTTQRLGMPLLTTSVTTAIGFFALSFAQMPPFKIFGFFAMLGIVLSWFITITVLPAFLTLMKPKTGGYYNKKRAMRVYNEQSKLALLLTRLGAGLEKQRVLATVLLVTVVAVAAFGASKLYVNSSWLSDFKKDSEVALSTDVLNEKFDGTVFLHVVVEGVEPNTLKRVEVLRQIEALQEHVETLPYVGGSTSVVDFLKSMNKTLNGGNQAAYVLPTSEQEVSEYLFLFSVSGRPQQLAEVVDNTYRQGLISVAIKTDYTRELKTIIDEVNGFVSTNFRDLPVSVNLAGSANNSFVWGDLLISSQASAILFSKVGILLIAALIFFSVMAGIYVVLPVSLTTLLVAGASGFLDIPLDVSTALAAGIAIGVGVDYAVHYLFRYRFERQAGLDHSAATAATMRSAGRTVVLNATVVTAGFAVLFMSQFPPHIKLGYFVAAYMVLSCLVAIVLLPLLLSLFKPKFASGAR